MVMGKDNSTNCFTEFYHSSLNSVERLRPGAFERFLTIVKLRISVQNKMKSAAMKTVT